MLTTKSLLREHARYSMQVRGYRRWQKWKDSDEVERKVSRQHEVALKDVASLHTAAGNKVPVFLHLHRAFFPSYFSLAAVEGLSEETETSFCATSSEAVRTLGLRAQGERDKVEV